MAHQNLPPRHTYLLRVWGERGGDGAALVYRFSLQEAQSGERQGFATFDALVAYLRDQLDASAVSEAPATALAPRRKGLSP
jgi:hypothetical protein